MRIGAVILCGGNSKRMGREKALLQLKDKTFVQLIAEQLQEIDEVLLSVGSAARELLPQYRQVIDEYPDCGPMGGLHAALTACCSDVLLAVACDLPLFHRDLTQLLCSSLQDSVDAVIPVTTDGRIHPLCAVYRKETAAVFTQSLAAGRYRLRDALEDMQVCYVTVPQPLERCLQNINTPEDYQKIYK